MNHFNGSILAIGLIAVGCNHENLRAEQNEESKELAAEQASERRDLAEDQREVSQEHAELTQEQRQERAELQQDHAEERHEAREDSREDLIDKTNDMGGDREELSEEIRELNALIAQACTGIAENERAVCPLTSDRIADVSNIGDGVRITMAPIAGTKSLLESRAACYRARAEVRHSVQRLSANNQPEDLAVNDCLLDQPGVEMELTETDGQVRIELTTEGATRVRELRTQARVLMPSAATRANERPAANAAGNSSGVALR